MKKTKKRSRVALPFFLALILLVGSAAGYYSYQLQKPKQAAELFMQSMQNLDFDTMASMLQTEDLSILDEADIRNSAYTEFFRSMCEKLTYKITKTKLHMLSKTAEVTVRLNYVDGAEIYKAASSDFLRQIASVSFSGNQMSETELKQTLADTLIKTEENTEASFLSTEITYPMISINNEWKIVSLDNESIKIMSSNFSSVEDEFENSLVSAEDGNQVSMQPAVSDTDVIDMDTERFRIHYTQFRITKDISGNSCLLVYYEYTNKDTSASSCPMIDVNLQAVQTGDSLEAAIPETTETALDLYMSEVSPQQTVSVCQAFSLKDTSDVTLTANDAFTFSGESTSQILKLQ